VSPVHHVLDGGLDPPKDGDLLVIMYLTPLWHWTHPVFAPTGHNKFWTAGEGDATWC